MKKLTPMQEVKERFGSKDELADKLIPLLDRPEDLDQDEFELNIRTASNKQLLRLHAATETVKRRFGSKEGLVDTIVSQKFPKGNAPYREKLMKLRATRLLDLYSSI